MEQQGCNRLLVFTTLFPLKRGCSISNSFIFSQGPKWKAALLNKTGDCEIGWDIPPFPLIVVRDLSWLPLRGGFEGKQGCARLIHILSDFKFEELELSSLLLAPIQRACCGLGLWCCQFCSFSNYDELFIRLMLKSSMSKPNPWVSGLLAWRFALYKCSQQGPHC